MIIKILKENSLQIQDFCRFAGINKNRFHYAIKKNDPIYMKGLEGKLYDFLEWKIEQLQETMKMQFNKKND